MDYANRPARGRQVNPTTQEVKRSIVGIRDAAAAGNLTATIALVMLEKADALTAELRAIKQAMQALEVTVTADASRRRNSQLASDFKVAIDELKAAMLAAADKAAA